MKYVRTTKAFNMKNTWLNLISILALKKMLFHIEPFQFVHVPPHTHTLMLFTEPVAPEALSSKYGRKNSPPPLPFSHPSLPVPEKARNVGAAQFNPAQSKKKN